MLRYLSAGESHGKCLVVILEAMPAGLPISIEFINRELKKRLSGYGRGPRSKGIEDDKVEFLSGVRKNVTLGSPIAMRIKNRDYKIDVLGEISRPRPGHADLAGALKYNQKDIRNILERSSARETAVRVAAGAVCKLFLNEFGVDILSHVVSIGGVKADTKGLTFHEIKKRADKSSLRCADKTAEKLMRRDIDKIKGEKDTLGGTFEIMVRGVPAGIGSHVHYDRKLDGQLALALMSIQAIKGVEIGLGFEAAQKAGSDVHDEIYYQKTKGFYHKTNNAGGIEGGMSNGEPIVVRCAMKPIPTLMEPLVSIDINSKKLFKAQVERSDTTAVPAAAIVAESAVSFELAKGYLDKFGGDSMDELKRNFKG
ncbi:MAG: chorismate synthase, partial [Candidatus Omnitrophica bacterium]|nr:chorismate synthase [Candidatus Omnitrophota bacterium]